jgi:hypothetical protein
VRTAKSTEHRLTAGDIESDSNDDCCPCCQSIVDDNAVTCDVCQNSIHQRCTGLPSDVYDVLLSIVKYAGWVCQDCRSANKSRLSNVQSALAHTNDVLADVRVLLDHLQNEVKSIKENSTSDSPNSASSAAQIALTGDIISSQTHAAASDVRSKTAVSEVTLEIHRTINEISTENK